MSNSPLFPLSFVQWLRKQARKSRRIDDVGFLAREIARDLELRKCRTYESLAALLNPESRQTLDRAFTEYAYAVGCD